jgi:hypothetical protein
MGLQEIQLPHNHQLVMNRFITACQVDQRVMAAFLGGSNANGLADAYSDLDLYLITSDAAYENFIAEKATFIRLLGEPLFLEDFGRAHGLFYIFSDATEGELWIGREGHFDHIHAGAYRVLLDKKAILKDAIFPGHEADPTAQIEILRQQVSGFWHELSHFIKAMGRSQLWFAYGQLEALRHMCVNLARLRYNFADPSVGEEPYFKVEQALPIEQLSPLQMTYCPMEYEVMLQAALTIFRFYREVAPTLARAHGIPYQADLERMMMNQLETLGNVRLS